MIKSFYFNALLILLVTFPCLALGAEEAVPADSTLERDMGYFYGFSFAFCLDGALTCETFLDFKDSRRVFLRCSFYSAA